MMFYLAGAIYAAIFWYVGMKHPRIPLMLIFAAAPLQNDISGGGPFRFSLAEINLILAVPLLLLKNRRLSLGPLTPAIGFYMLVSVGCTFLHWRYTSAVSLIQMVLYLVVAVIVFSGLAKTEDDFRLAMDALIVVSVAMAVSVLLKGNGYVWNLHKNGVGSSLGAALIVCTELWFGSSGRRKRIISAALLILAAGLFFTLSRGAWMGAMVGIVVLVVLRGEYRLLLKIGLVLIPLIAICWAYLPDSSKDYATGFSAKDNFNIKMRYESVDLARDIFLSSPIIGRGVGLRKEYDATNLFWCTLAETGLIGLVALIVLHAGILRLAWRTQRHLDRSTTLYSCAALGGALVVSRMLHGMVDHYWGRGPNTVVWSAVGMTLFAYYAKKRYIATARHAAVETAEERGREYRAEISATRHLAAIL